MLSKERVRDPGSLKKWHRSLRLWHRLPRLSALVTESEVTAQSPPCSFFALSLIPIDKVFYSPDDAIATAAARVGKETRAGGGVAFNVKWRR